MPTIKERIKKFDSDDAKKAVLLFSGLLSPFLASRQPAIILAFLSAFLLNHHKISHFVSELKGKVMRAFGGNARRYRAETIKPDDKALDFIRHLNPYTVFEKIGYSEIAEHACAGRTSNDRNAKSFLLLNKTDLADFSSDEKEFIILHEMGHVVNGDLKWFHSLPYKAKNITFLAGVFVLANHFFIRSNLLFVDNLSTRRMMLCSLIALALNSALQRSKEYKADLWAIKNGAKKNAVEKFLSGKIDEEENESNNFFSYFDYMIFSDHPYSKDRIDAIQKHTPQEP